MEDFKKIVFWTFWPTLISGIVSYRVFFSHFDDNEKRLVYFLLLLLLWEILILIITILVKWIEYRKENPALTKEERQRLKQLRKEEKYRNSEEFKKKYFSDVEIENSYFGNGVLVKDSSYETICYTDIKSGFDRIFDSFGKKSDESCDLYEFIVREDNIEYVLASLEKIYKKSEQIMEECYDKIYKEIVEFFEDVCDENLKDEFDLDYLKENWYVYGLAIYDDYMELSIGIKAAENSEADSYFDILVLVEYSTQEPEVSFEVVW